MPNPINPDHGFAWERHEIDASVRGCLIRNFGSELKAVPIIRVARDATQMIAKLMRQFVFCSFSLAVWVIPPFWKFIADEIQKPVPKCTDFVQIRAKPACFGVDASPVRQHALEALRPEVSENIVGVPQCN